MDDIPWYCSHCGQEFSDSRTYRAHMTFDPEVQRLTREVYAEIDRQEALMERMRSNPEYLEHYG